MRFVAPACALAMRRSMGFSSPSAKLCCSTKRSTSWLRWQSKQQIILTAQICQCNDGFVYPPFSHVQLPEFAELLAYLLQCYPSYDYSSGILGSGPKEFWVANPKMSGHVEGFETEWTEDGYALFLKKTSPNPNHHELRVTVATENLSDLLFQACIVGFRWKCKSQKYVYFLSSRIFITPWKMNEHPWKGTISKGNFICQSILGSAC